MAIWSEKKYNRINWQNRPSTATALGATNLNKIDVFCNEVDNAMIQMDAQKLNLSTANSMISSLTIDVDTGVITAKQLDGTTFTWDLNLEKIPVSFSLSEDGILTMTTEDGTEWTCNISELIKDYVFDDSDTIAFEKEFSEEDESGKGAYHVTASVKAGSINETHLDPDYRADILTYKNQAQTAANDALTYSKDSKRWAVGDPEYEGSDIDNSKYYKEQAEAAKTAAEQARDEAQAATGAVVATTTQVGVVKPDGTTIDVTSDGTISAKQATSTTPGIIKPDGETVTVDEYGVLHGAQKFDEEGYVFVDNETVIPPGQEEEAILNADKLGGELPAYYAKQGDIGEKTNLTTTAKTDLVAAINEVDGNIGDLSGLTTTAKTNLVSAVNELNQNMNGLEDDISELTSDMSGKQNKISNQSFVFTPNEAGITTSSIRCFRYGNVCIVTGTFTPNQAGTPLTLGGFNVHPTQDITFPITGYEKVASYGTLSASGVFQCNIPGAMANETCAINFAFLTAQDQSASAIT